MAKANKDQDISGNLESMDAANLFELRRLIALQIDNRMAERHQEAVGKLRDLAKEYDLSVGELIDLARGKKKKSSLPAKYRHPKDPDLTWTGLGRRPQWLVSYIGDGGALEDLRI